MKRFSMITVLILTINLLISSTALAADTTLNVENEYYKIGTTDTGDEIIVQPNEVATSVLVFIGGILAGYIIDGVLIKTTGMSGGEWVAKALSFHKKDRSCTNIYLSKRTGKAVCHSGGSRGF